MGTVTADPTESSRGWGVLGSVLVRFAFTYWLLYSLPVILSFPAQFASLVVRQTVTQSEPTPPWLTESMNYLGYPSSWHSRGMALLAPSVSQSILGVAVEPPANFTGSGARLFNYCTAFTDLVIAVGVTVVWTVASESWYRLRTRRRPDYDRLHAWLRAVVRFHLMVQMLVYGAMKVWCGQFPPVSDGQLEVRHGDSSPMGLLWRFMQFSQAYTSATGFCAGSEPRDGGR